MSKKPVYSDTLLRSLMHPSEYLSYWRGVNEFGAEVLSTVIGKCRHPQRHQDKPEQITVTLYIRIGNDLFFHETHQDLDPPTLPGFIQINFE